MIQLFISQLEQQNVELDGVEPAAVFELENDPVLEIVDDLHYHLRAQLISGGVLVEGRAFTRVRGNCGRCLKEVEQEVGADAISLFFDMPPGETLDITDDIREEVAAELPTNLLCREDCAGLCPVCGADRNTTPCDCVVEDFPPESGEPGQGDDEKPSPWDALDQLK